MIKRLIDYLTIERKTEYIQYKSSSKSNNARNYISFSTLKAISIKISTICFMFVSKTFDSSKFMFKYFVNNTNNS